MPTDVGIHIWYVFEYSYKNYNFNRYILFEGKFVDLKLYMYINMFFGKSFKKKFVFCCVFVLNLSLIKYTIDCYKITFYTAFLDL